MANIVAETAIQKVVDYMGPTGSVNDRINAIPEDPTLAQALDAGADISALNMGASAANESRKTVQQFYERAVS
jgi:hypothetical protein